MRGQAFEEGRTRAAADEARRLNRARMGLDVMNTSTGMLTNTARQGAATANQPLQLLAETAGRAGQVAGGYLGAPKDDKKKMGEG